MQLFFKNTIKGDQRQKRHVLKEAEPEERAGENLLVLGDKEAFALCWETTVAV